MDIFVLKKDPLKRLNATEYKFTTLQRRDKTYANLARVVFLGRDFDFFFFASTLLVPFPARYLLRLFRG